MNVLRPMVILGFLVLGSTDFSNAQSANDFKQSSNEEVFFYLARFSETLPDEYNRLGKLLGNDLTESYLKIFQLEEWTRADEFKKRDLLSQYRQIVKDGTAAVDLSKPLVFYSERNSFRQYDFNQKAYPIQSNRFSGRSFTFSNGNGSVRGGLPTDKEYEMYFPMSEDDARAFKTESKYRIHDQYFHIRLVKDDQNQPKVKIDKFIFTHALTKRVIGEMPY